MVDAYIKEAGLKELMGAGVNPATEVFGQHGGFGIRIRADSNEKILVTTKGGVRLFASLDTAMEFLRRLGVEKFEVNTYGYEHALLRKPRPDRAAALKQTRTKVRQSNLW